MSDPTPEQKILEIFSLFTSLPVAYQEPILEKLQGLVKANIEGWQLDDESGEIEVELIIDDDDFYSHRHDKD
jgi:hypothetical protein